ncbi:MAG: hypothetical protein KRP56_04950 [Candidatus Methanogranum gryphiswaldense]|nr:MAG: hypothetical protein KRP56_04950 [Candidatus Methanogranum sp. U3.2.1]
MQTYRNGNCFVEVRLPHQFLLKETKYSFDDMTNFDKQVIEKATNRTIFFDGKECVRPISANQRCVRICSKNIGMKVVLLFFWCAVCVCS